MADTVVERAQNKAGKWFAIIREGNGTFGVWVRCANYAAHVLGGVSYSWRYCERRLTEVDARKLFARKVKGGAK